MQSTKTFSGYQLFWVMFLYNVGMATVIMVGPTIQYAKQDAWISKMVLGVISLFVTYVSIRVTKLYPGCSFVELCRNILGKWLGNAFVLLYILQWSTVIGVAIRQVDDYITLTIYQRTPLIVFVVTTVVLLTYMIHARGIESIGRVCNVIGPVTILFLLLINVLSIPNAKFQRLLPVDIVGNWLGILQGSTPGASFTAHSMIVMVLIPFLRPGHIKAPRGALWGVGIAAFMLMIDVMMIVAVLGPVLPSRLRFPITDMTAYISIEEFLQNLEVFIVLVWFFSAVIRLAVYQFAAAHCWSEFLGLKSWRMTNFAISIVSIVIAMIPKNAAQATVDYTTKFIEPIVYPYLLVAGPLLLLAVGLIRKGVARLI